MRRLVFGLLVAALVMWAWSSWRGEDAAAGDGSLRTDLAAMLASAGEVTGNDAPAVPTAATDPALEQAFAELARKVETGDAEARRQALRLLGRPDLLDAHRVRLSALLGQTLESGAEPANPSGAQPGEAETEASAAPAAGRWVAPAGEDLPALLQRIGDNNDFLHEPAGLALGRRALQLWTELGFERDADAVALGTELIERCMRGPIGRADKAAIAFVDEVYAAYRVRADRVLCDPANLGGARSHTVGKGDSLDKIAAVFRKEGIAMEAGTLAVLNRIHNMNAIRVGQMIRCPIDPIHAVLERRSFLLAVYVGERVLRLYWVGHGAESKTPVTEFTVSEKLKNPDWYSPDGAVHPFGSPENILGRYFIKFDHPSYSGFGAHGTPQPETIGTMSSMGCIRMYDDDIEELFRLLPRKARVVVRDSH
ncbi:MAG: L,D-transpeptidase family protein [Planctomycetota bacterium]